MEEIPVDWSQIGWGIFILVIGIAVVLSLTLSFFIAEMPARVWIGGGAALGLVTGFVTGASKNTADNGSGSKLISFIGSGLVVPIMGAIAALVGSSEKTTVDSVYQNDQIVQRTTETVTTYPSSLLHPIAVFGAFFVAFSLLALIGIGAGALARKGGGVEVLMAT